MVKEINQKQKLLFFYRYGYFKKILMKKKSKVDKKNYKNIDIYYVGYIRIKKIDDC